MPLATQMTVVVDALQAKLEAVREEYGVSQTSYGDQVKLPGGNIVCFEPDTKAVELKGAQFKTELTFTVYIIVYTASIQSPEMNRKESDELAEKLEVLFNSDVQLGGLLIHGYVSEVASGYSTKDNSIVRSNRLTYTGISQSRLLG